MKHIFILIHLLLFFLTFKAQTDSLPTSDTDTTDLSNLSIEELSQLKSRYKSTDIEKLVTQAMVATSRKPLSLKRSPSIVSIVTANDIEKSGARDIMDVFRLVPGIDFNIDVQGVVGISFRGLWANEGKVLLLLDGQEMNEIAYCTLILGNNYNISQIQKIEVIRGPGSAIYGGFAEYAVINIISKSAEEINGISCDIIAGQAVGTYARQNISVAVGKKINDFAFSMSALVGRGQRSNSVYSDINGKTYNMTRNSNLNPTNVNVSLNYKGFSTRFMYDLLSTTMRDGYLYALSKPYTQTFSSYLAEAKYVQKVGNTLQLQVRFNYKHGLPWNFKAIPDSIDTNPSYQIIVKRYRANVAAIWDAKYWLNIVAGAEAYYDNALKPLLINGEPQVFRNANTHQVSYENYAAFVQSLLKLRFANITLGARYDFNSASGAAFNPRLGITKRVGRFNFKLLYASSYRAPGIENIQTSLNGHIVPEKSRTFELETGLQISRNAFISLNLYDISTDNAIRYIIDTSLSGTPEGYINATKTIGSQGIDIDYKYKSAIGFIDASYAYYTVAHKNVDADNAVSLDRRAHLGIANHKFTVVGGVNIGKYLYISPSIIFLGKRYGYTALDSLQNPVLGIYKPQAQFNIYMGCQQLKQRLSFGMGVYNFTNKEIIFIQPYKGLHGGYPGMGAEIIFRLKYDISFHPKNKVIQ